MKSGALPTSTASTSLTLSTLSTLINPSFDRYATTDSFHVDAEDDSDPNSTLRKLCHGKEGGWALQVVVALAVDHEGVPVRSWLLPGNTADVSTVARVCADLRG